MHLGITTQMQKIMRMFLFGDRYKWYFFLFKKINNSKPPKNLPKCYSYLDTVYKSFSQHFQNPKVLTYSLPENFLCMLTHLRLFPKSQVFVPETAHLPLYLLLLAIQKNMIERVNGELPILCSPNAANRRPTVYSPHQTANPPAGPSVQTPGQASASQVCL